MGFFKKFFGKNETENKNSIPTTKSLKLANEKIESNEQLGAEIIKGLKTILNLEVIEKNQQLFIPEYDLTVEIEPNVQPNGVVNFKCVLSHPSWQEKISESFSGFGNEALGMAVSNFYLSFLPIIFKMIKKEMPDGEMTTKLDTQTHAFNIYKSPIIVSRLMEKNPKEISFTLDDSICKLAAKYIGNQKNVFMKIFMAMSGDSFTAEWKINNTLIPALSTELQKYKPLFEDQGFYTGLKAYLLFENKVDPSYPHTYEEIVTYTLQSLPSLIELLDDDTIILESTDYVEKINQLINDPLLANEIYSFVSEDATEIILDGCTFNDEISLFIKDETLQLNRYQITAYRPIFDGVYEYYVRASQEDRKRANDVLVKRSATLSAINQALSNGANLPDLFVQLAFTMEDDYRIR